METNFVSEEFVKEYFADKYQNTRIKNAKIEYADVILFRGFLAFDLEFTYGVGCQGYMSPALTGNTKDGWSDKGSGNFIGNILELLGDYDSNERIRTKSLKGLPCRVFSNDCGVYAIGNFLEDKWFIPEYYYEKLKENE